MATLNVTVPDGMEADVEAYLAEHPHALDKSERVRDAIRHLLTRPGLSPDVLARVQAGRDELERGEDAIPLDETG